MTRRVRDGEVVGRRGLVVPGSDRYSSAEGLVAKGRSTSDGGGG